MAERPPTAAPGKTTPPSRRNAYLSVAAGLTAAVAAVAFGWHGGGGSSTNQLPADQLSSTSAVLVTTILVFRQGLEAILVLTAVSSGLPRKPDSYRRHFATGGVVGLLGAWVSNPGSVRGV